MFFVIDEDVEQEDLGQLSFEQFLNHTKKENPHSGVAFRMRICCLLNSESRRCA